MDEFKLGKQQDRGNKARELLDSESFKETLAYLESEYINSWRVCKEDQPEARERLWTAVRCLDHIRAHLTKLTIDGRLATKDLAGIKYFKR